MGRGDNRKTPKTRQRKAWRRKKLRIRKKIEAGANKVSTVKAATPKSVSSGAPVVKKKSASKSVETTTA